MMIYFQEIYVGSIQFSMKELSLSEKHSVMLLNPLIEVLVG